MSDDLDWLRDCIEGGARVPISERRVGLVAGDGEIAVVDAPEPPEAPGALLGADMEWYEIDVPHYVLQRRGDARAQAPGERAGIEVQRVRQVEVIGVAAGTAHHQPGRFETLQRRQRQMGRGGP